MLKVVVIEDEAVLRKGLIKKLNRLFPDSVEVIGEAGTVVNAVSLLQQTSPDLVLLDVELADGISFDILSKLAAIDFQIIFVTAHNHYAIQAIKASALDYLMKPIDDNELINAVNACLKTKGTDQTKQQVALATRTLQQGVADKIVLRTSNEYHLVTFGNILYCASDGGYTTFFLKNGSRIMVSKPIKDFEETLPSAKFIRTHQSYVVNSAYVTKYDRDGFLILGDYDVKVPVSTRKREEVIAQLFS